ncbi:MAG TPA: glycosyltransferase [Verrucomicrobiae bacterium]|nr:glycosyltransferase [Verrucomicrobiae bacterium]
MLSSRLYYGFKPYLPWQLRIAARRVLARSQRRRSAHIWPINEAAGHRPDGWPGWPDGKKFSLVLTHDVEGTKGLEKCRKLMEIELRMGFRSSFNFIPEGEYQVSPALREELAAKGFEVGVHDLRHDGKLYWRRSEFPENARSINSYLKDWRASGFRSGFMLHNPDCLNGLDIEYDASTFDTDPFEPQPEGVHTIFPFWVPRPEGGGYVELPYTLPQDSTMFLVLQETSIDIWKRKLDWIVQRGGMALINIHPDYVGFNGEKTKATEYLVAHYEQFLQYIKDNYAGQYLNQLPREVAAWYRRTCVETSPQLDSKNTAATAGDNELRGRRAAVVLYSYYASDPRPRRETEALQRAGMEVDVICLREGSDEPALEVLDGVNVHRIPLQRRRAGKLTYAFQYFSFLVSAGALLSWWRLRRRYDLVHVHNMPDFLVFSALLPKLLGARVILDLHDPMPELLVTIFGLEEKSFAVRLLKFFEKHSIRFADQVLTVNQACKEIFSARSCPPEKIQVLMNVPDERVFKYHDCLDYPERDPARPFVVMFHGSIVERNGLDIAVEALRLLRKSVPNAELWVYGASTPFLNKVMDPASLNGLSDAVRYLGPKSQKEIVAAIHTCDVGVIPNRNNAFTEINTPTRIFEYLSLGKPVVSPRSKGITDYFGPQDMVYFELGDAASLAKQLEFICRNPEQAQAVTERGQQVYRSQCWSQARAKFIGRVVELLRPRS